MGAGAPQSGLRHNGKNQIGGAWYDPSGNQTVVNGDTMAYDAENRQTSATEPPALGGGTENYVYDGDGKRVEKTGPGGTTVYVYDALGRLAGEYGTNGPISPCTTCYLTWDHLGSTRLVTDQNADIIARHDYLPFGEEIPASTAGRNGLWGPQRDVVSQKFTGKERDAETGLDYFGARYYTAGVERFTSVDPETGSNDLSDPQSWNAYGYTRNNPLLFTDPTGRNYTVCDQRGQNCADLTDKQFSDYLNNNPNVQYSPGGNLTYYNENGTYVNLGSASYYNEQDVQGAQQIAATAPIGDALLGTTLFFIQGPGMGFLGATAPELAGLGIAERSALADQTPVSSTYEDVTAPDSRVPNRATNVSKATFEKNLSDSGWSKSTSQDGRVTLYTKGGARYVVRDNAGSTGGPTADYYAPGSRSINLKVRLQ